MKYQGSCHCKVIQFEVEAPEHIEVEQCNCSICQMAGSLHLIIPLSKFTLHTGEASLSTYTFNTQVAKHTFCKHCGIKPFYIPRSNPDGVSINPYCLHPPPKSIMITSFDGQNWEQNAHTLAHKSIEKEG